MHVTSCMTTNYPSNKDYQEKSAVCRILEAVSGKKCEGQARSGSSGRPGMARPKMSGSKPCGIIYCKTTLCEAELTITSSKKGLKYRHRQIVFYVQG
jgi:hypothetical protein